MMVIALACIACFLAGAICTTIFHWWMIGLLLDKAIDWLPIDG